MDISVCKNCKFHSLDTLTDGTKEDYCYPPIFPHMIAFSIPCSKRSESDCKKILKDAGELPWVEVK